MKNLLFILFVAFFAFACDKVKDPIVNKKLPPVDTTSNATALVKNDNTNMDLSKKTVLLEDYTGQKCPNCPDAAKVATTIAESNPDQVYLMAVHQGDFAKPTPPTYTNEFRTSAGTAWGVNYSIATWPIGMINRKMYTGTSITSVRSNWSSAVSIALTETVSVQLQVFTEYNTDTRVLNTKVKGTFMGPINENVQVSAVLLEDSIIGRQTLPSGEEQLDYRFDHLLRGTMPDTQWWGSRLKTMPIVAGADSTIDVGSFTVKSNYNDKQLSVLVFATKQTSREVLQVAKVKIRK